MIESVLASEGLSCVASIRLAHPPESDEELYYLVQALWGVVIPRNTCGDPSHTSAFEVFADAYFGRNGTIALWHGSRGLSGKSFMLSILGLTKAFVLGADVNLLGGSLAQSANIHEHMRAAMEYENAPYQEMVLVDSQTLIKLTNKARIRPLTASQKTVRGPHPPFLLLDEIDEMDINILDAALGQPMPQENYLGEEIKPYTVLCSTWQNPEGTFTQIRRRFEERGLPMKTWCYRCSANPIDGWLSQETIEQKKREIPAEMWRVEYELGEPSIGNRAFNSDAVEEMFSLPMDPIESDVKRDNERYLFAQPDKTGQYVAAADWAKEQDHTVITVWRVDGPTCDLVYYHRVNRHPYPMMIGWFNDALRYFDAEAIHDATGLGNVVADYLDLRVRNFHMTGEKRDDMLSEHVVGVERGRIRAPRIPSMYLAYKYAQVGDLYNKGKEFHLPDEVCSGALAWHIAKKGVGAGAPQMIPKSGEPDNLDRHFRNPYYNPLLGNSGAEKVVVTAEPTMPMGEVREKSDGNSLSFIV